MTDPAALSPLERYADELVRFDNRDRYVQQSKHTQVNAPAPLPARMPLLPLTFNGEPA